MTNFLFFHYLPSSHQSTHTPHRFINTHTPLPLRPSGRPCYWRVHRRVIPQDEASCFDNSCEAQCLFQQNTDWLIISKMLAISSLFANLKEDQVACMICDPLTQNRNNLSTAVMILLFAKTMALIRDRPNSWLLIQVHIRLHIAKARAMQPLNRLLGGILLHHCSLEMKR